MRTTRTALPNDPPEARCSSPPALLLGWFTHKNKNCISQLSFTTLTHSFIVLKSTKACDRCRGRLMFSTALGKENDAKNSHLLSIIIANYINKKEKSTLIQKQSTLGFTERDKQPTNQPTTIQIVIVMKGKLLLGVVLLRVGDSFPRKRKV